MKFVGIPASPDPNRQHLILATRRPLLGPSAILTTSHPRPLLPVTEKAPRAILKILVASCKDHAERCSLQRLCQGDSKELLDSPVLVW